jgi:hypothetical protein
VQKFLTEANKAAKIAATARLNEERKQQGNLLQAARANLPRTTTEVGWWDQGRTPSAAVAAAAVKNVQQTPSRAACSQSKQLEQQLQWQH